MIHKSYSDLFKSSKSKGRFDRINPTEIDDKFKWHSMIHTLINELNMTVDKVYEQNYLSTLNWLSFFDNKRTVEINKQR